MNKVVITKCIECNNWTPADSYGGGVYCDEMGEKVSDDIDCDIPDHCPKISQDKAESNNTESLATALCDKLLEMCSNPDDAPNICDFFEIADEWRSATDKRE